MIQMTFKYISLVAAETSGARIAFPKQKHNLEIFLSSGGATTQLTSGADIRFIVEKNKVPQSLGAPGGTPIGGRVVSLGGVLGGGPYTLNSTSTLTGAGGKAQAVLDLHGGTFSPEDAKDGDPYNDSYWTFGTGAAAKTQQLTDTLVWTTPYDGALEYFLEIDGARYALGDQDQLLFSNDDTITKKVSTDANGDVILPELALLYDFVTPAPSNKYIPTTAFVATPQPVHTAGAPAGAPPAPPSPDMPLCPVGQL